MSGRLSILLALTIFMAGCTHVPNASPQPHGSVAITNVTVIDVVTGAHQPTMTVVTSAGRIAKVGRDIALPPTTLRVNGMGKFLIPGLWDMHAHHQVTGAEQVDLFVANGVVGTRDMGADVEFVLPLRDRINRGELLGPEIVAAGPILDDRPADWPLRRRVTNAQDAREAVRDLKKRGVDFIKVHDGTPREAYFAIADEAPKLGLPFAGHIPIKVTVEEAADSGIKSVEHLANYRVINDCSANPPHNRIPCDVLFDKFASNGVWQTPTMAFMQAIPDIFSGKPLAHGEYASDSLLAFMRKNVEVSKLNEKALSSLRSNGQKSLRAIRDMLSHGIRFLAGSDGLVPGFSLEDELEWLTKAGLSPLQAIQAATINPAIFLGREKTQGSIEVGKRADLVMLEADPLTDISNIRRIAAVIARGQLLLKPDIKRIIASHRHAESMAHRDLPIE